LCVIPDIDALPVAKQLHVSSSVFGPGVFRRPDRPQQELRIAEQKGVSTAGPDATDLHNLIPEKLVKNKRFSKDLIKHSVLQR
jgi:hypothetical protein